MLSDREFGRNQHNTVKFSCVVDSPPYISQFHAGDRRLHLLMYKRDREGVEGEGREGGGREREKERERERAGQRQGD